jgi:hypothetical protein
VELVADECDWGRAVNNVVVAYLSRVRWLQRARAVLGADFSCSAIPFEKRFPTEEDARRAADELREAGKSVDDEVLLAREDLTPLTPRDALAALREHREWRQCEATAYPDIPWNDYWFDWMLLPRCLVATVGPPFHLIGGRITFCVDRQHRIVIARFTSQVPEAIWRNMERSTIGSFGRL